MKSDPHHDYDIQRYHAEPSMNSALPMLRTALSFINILIFIFFGGKVPGHPTVSREGGWDGGTTRRCDPMCINEGSDTTWTSGVRRNGSRRYMVEIFLFFLRRGVDHTRTLVQLVMVKRRGKGIYNHDYQSEIFLQPSA
jgi:hypothetical protein